MRLGAFRVLSSRMKIALATLLLAGPQAGFTQPSGSVEARMRAIEARVAALEGRAGPSSTAAAPASGPSCRRLNVNGSSITPGATLTVTVNGTIVATFDGSAHGDLEPFMRPGPNTIGLSFASPGSGGTSAELRCLPPNVDSSRTVVLRLKPTPARLSSQTQVILPGR